ncbi:MAG: DeoR/GlpR transcriptional regulator [Enterocloster asparagiformis]|nr:DeoR/GlpR transcriptional regulator [Enterocloster asparagiformis]
MNTPGNKALLRHQRIKSMLANQETVSLSEFCGTLNCSESTIRNDLRFLESQGVLKRTFGGAMLLDTVTNGYNITVRSTANQQYKALMADYIVKNIIVPGSTIALDSGSTALEIAKKLCEAQIDITVITNSFAAAAVLAQHESINFYLAGGNYSPHTGSFFDEITTAAITSLYADLFFFTAHGVSADVGFTIGSSAEGPIKRTMIQCSKKTIAVLDHTKIGHTGLKLVCGFDSIHTIITDSLADPSAVNSLRQKGVEVILVPAASPAEQP